MLLETKRGMWSIFLKIKGDLWSLIGVIFSAVMVVSSLLGNISVLQFLFTFLLGSFATYFVQVRLQDRSAKKQLERSNFALMRETIYGPLFKQINQLIEKLKTFEKPQLEKIDEIMVNHLYFVVPEELRQLINGFFKRVRRYMKIEEITDGVALQISIETFRQDLKRHRLAVEPTIYYNLLVGNKLVKRVNLYQALLQGKTPNEILKEEAEGLKAISIQILVGGLSYDPIEDVHKACEKALDKMRSSPIFEERESERKYLIDETEKIIARIKQFIMLEKF